MCQFCKVPLFSNGMQVCLFWWVPFLLGVSDADGAVLVFYSYVHKAMWIFPRVVKLAVFTVLPVV